MIPIPQANAPSRMSGFVRWARSNTHPYRDPHFVAAFRLGWFVFTLKRKLSIRHHVDKPGPFG
jgi:hypothetical protein